jgi:dihydrolipoamide dehydrogenase
MQTYDLIVIGSGAGMNVAANAAGAGMRTAVVEHGPLGGTCLNNGCIPTKVLLYPADVIRALDDAAAIGVYGSAPRVDFGLIMRRMRAYVDEGREEMERALARSDNPKAYRGTGEFTGDYTMRVGEETLTAPKIVIASGARTLVPPVAGLRETGYLDNVSVLNLKEPPKSLIILGGGYIACEYGHFFSAIGTKVTIIGRNPRLLKEEEPEISDIVLRRFSRHADIRANHEAVQVSKKGHKKAVFARDRTGGKVHAFTADEILLAVGRQSNADLLKPEKTGVQTDENGWVIVNEYMETSKPNIWALGDATGRHMFRHTANYESNIVWHNLSGEQKHRADFHAVPHAVFGYPQVAGVGMTEAEAKAAGRKILVGRALYTDVTKGYAMGEDDSLVKVIVEQGTDKVLGCHIVGSDAAILVQPVVYIMNAGDQSYSPLADSQVIHPALSEAVIRAFARLAPPEHEHKHP